MKLGDGSSGISHPIKLKENKGISTTKVPLAMCAYYVMFIRKDLVDSSSSREVSVNKKGKS